MAVASALGGGDKKHETHEQPSSGVGERRHTDEGEVEAERARSWLEYWGGNFLPEVREFITRHTAYNKHDTGCEFYVVGAL